MGAGYVKMGSYQEGRLGPTERGNVGEENGIGLMD